MIIDEHSVMDTGGKVIFLTSLGVNLTEWILKLDFNDVITGAMSVAGLIYIIVKIQGQRLDNRAKRKKLKESGD